MRPRELAVAAAAAAVFLASWTLVQTGTFTRGEISDLPVYQTYGDRMEDGDLPYRDFRVEYPPGALPAFLAPSLLSDSEAGYRSAFESLMFACGLAAILLAALVLSFGGASLGRTAGALGLMAVSPLLLGSVVLTRFDLWPAALTVGALAALVAGRARVGAVVLGAAIAAKLYPLVVVPLLAAWLWRRHGRREAVVGVGLTLAVPIAAYLPFFVLSPEAVVSSVGRQLSRPLQLESLGAAVLVGLHHAAGLPLGWASSHGSQNVTGTVAVVAAVLLSAAQVGALAWLWWRFWRGPAESERLLRYGAAAVVAFVALGKVLSPQFLIWLVPLVPLVAGRRGLVASGMLAAVLALTQVWFPSRYWDYVYTFDGVASAAILARDLALVALLGVLARPARAREPAPARSP